MAFNLFPQTDFRQMDLNYVLEVSKQAAANLEEYAADKEQVVATQAAAEEALAAAQQDIQTATQAAASAGQDAQTATQAAGTATQAAASAEQDAQTASAAAATATAVQESIPADYTTLSNDVDNLKSDINYELHDGYIDNVGNIVAPSADYEEKYTDPIPVVYGMDLVWEYDLTNEEYMWAAYLEYDSAGTRIGYRETLINERNSYASGKLSTSSNAATVVFTFRSCGEENAFNVKAVQYNAINNIYYSLNNSDNDLFYTWNISGVSVDVPNVPKGLYYFDATNLVNDSVRIEAYGEQTDVLAAVVKKGTGIYLYIPYNASRVYMRVISTGTQYSGTVTITKISNANTQKIPVETMIIAKSGNVDITDNKLALNRMWSNGGAVIYGGRIAVGLFELTGKFSVSIADYENYKFAVVDYNYKDTTVYARDAGWTTTGSRTIICDFGRCFGITIARTSGNIASLSEMDDIGLTITAVGDYYEKIATEDEIFAINNEIFAINEQMDQFDSIANNSNKTNLAVFTGRFKPCYDHLFVNKTGDNVIIPHESLYHVRLSHKMGYNTIEANIAKTSDNVYIVNHLNGGKFGGYFHHVDGETDISDIAVSSVTWDWIVQNVRYNSSIPKYRTRPCTLEEFLGECKQQNIIPFVTSTEANVIAIVESIMGKENYIAYGATRTNAPNAIIYHWISNLTTKTDILAYCKNIGAPFIFGMGNPTAFTDAELQDIVDTLHENGFWIGTSYADNLWYKYTKLGFDFNGSQTQTNRIESGNLYNLNSVFGFSDFDVTGGTETDGVLMFSNSGTIRPKIADDTENIICVDIEVWFNGSITLSAIGERGAQTVTSDGSYPFFVCTPILNGSPKFTITCASGTTVSDIKFKASRV